MAAAAAVAMGVLKAEAATEVVRAEARVEGTGAVMTVVDRAADERARARTVAAVAAMVGESTGEDGVRLRRRRWWKIRRRRRRRQRGRRRGRWTERRWHLEGFNGESGGAGDGGGLGDESGGGVSRKASARTRDLRRRCGGGCIGRRGYPLTRSKLQPVQQPVQQLLPACSMPAGTRVRIQWLN